MKGALFMAVGALVYRIGHSQISQFKGLGRQMPWTFAALVLAGLSLIGIPGTAGFISKWYLVLAAIEQQAWFIAVIILGGSLLAVIYMWKLVEALFFQSASEERAPVKEAPLSLLVPTWILVIANIYFGLNTELTVNAAEAAVKILENVSP
jgi:multicomponent Na+:H+ antiporter subunit D